MTPAFLEGVVIKCGYLKKKSKELMETLLLLH
jgi:hypothetical protein